MKDVKKELVSISTALTSLTQKIEKMVTTLEKESGKAAPKKTKMAKKAGTPAMKKAAPQAAPKTRTTAGSETILDNIYGMVRRSHGGITVDRLKKRTGLEARQVSNALYKLSTKGLVETVSRGVYVKKKK